MQKIEDCHLAFDLNETEHSIQTYILQNPTIVAKITLNVLADTLYTSNSTLIQFLKKIGYSGFTDLKLSIKKSIFHSEKDNTQLSLNQQSIQKFNDLFASQDQSTIIEIVEKITQQNPVYIHGRGMNAIAANYLFNNLLTIDIPCILIPEIQLLKKVTKRAKENTLVIVFSQESAHQECLGVVENAKTSKSSTLLITSRTNISEVARMFDYVLYTNDIPITYDGVDINSRIGFFTVAQLLIDATSTKLIKSTNNQM